MYLYFALQGAGIKFPGVDALTSLELYNVAVRPCLYYGCSSVYLSPVQLRNIDKFQNRILKQCLGLNKCARSSVLLKATGINTISDTVNISSLNILKSCILSTSLCNDFYCMLLKDDYLQNYAKNTLFYRVSKFCKNGKIHLSRFIHDSSYCKTVKKKLNHRMYTSPDSNGIIDTLRGLFINYDNNSRYLANCLLKAF